MQVNPEDGPPEIYVTWSGPRMTDFENALIKDAVKIINDNTFFHKWRVIFM